MSSAFFETKESMSEINKNSCQKSHYTALHLACHSQSQKLTHLLNQAEIPQNSFTKKFNGISLFSDNHLHMTQ